MKKIIIIGGGFAGLSALRIFSEARQELDVILIDKKSQFEFLPALPDVIGRRIKSQWLRHGLKGICDRYGYKFVNDEVIRLDLDASRVYTAKGDFVYDYLVIASGSATEFYGNEIIKEYAYPLHSLSEARTILAELGNNSFNTFVIGGGGYTGVEAATNVRRYFRGRNTNKRVVIVEKAPDILGPVPDWMKRYAGANLDRLGIEVFTERSVAHVAEDRVSLSNGKSFNNAMLIWSAGVKTSSFLSDKLNVDKNPQGRIKVDKFLRLTGNCFVCGDAAAFYYADAPLRMAIQFSLTQGRAAASNVIREISGLPSQAYKPIDLGYIIPMANNRSCGKVGGISLKGIPATMLHYLMCIYRSYGFQNKRGIIKDLLTTVQE